MTAVLALAIVVYLALTGSSSLNIGRQIVRYIQEYEKPGGKMWRAAFATNQGRWLAMRKQA